MRPFVTICASRGPNSRLAPATYDTAQTDGGQGADTGFVALDHGGATDGSANRSRFAEQMFQPIVKEMIMAITPNKDQVKGELKDLGGKIQEEAGKLVGSKEQEAKGLRKQAQGKLQKAVGDLKEAVTDAVTKA